MMCKKIAVVLCIGVVLVCSVLADESKAKSSSAIDPNLLLDKIHGSLYGKCIGLVLGQPMEGWETKITEQKARDVNSWPITYYLPNNFDTGLKGFLFGNFDCYPPNDDTALMMMGLIALRENGLNFTAKQLAQIWSKSMDGACTAEGVALYNFKREVWPPESGVKDNPYCQWIGAQMRVDIWGMIAPGLPQVAAEYAERDACISHAGNGIYAAKYVAVLISLAMNKQDVRAVVQDALAVIPEHCEYARAIRDVIACYDRGDDWHKTWQMVDDRYGWNDDGTRVGDFIDQSRYDKKTKTYESLNARWVHAVPNGAMVVLALLYGKGDFSNSICLAAMCGYDCDCNGGTVGSVIGAMIGEKNIPARWKEPLNNRFKTGVHHNFPEELKISDLAAEITGFAKQQLKVNEKSVNVN
ncbi:MAG: ADP-ribosylglycohydrolase family protein [Phycisphaerales bacterium]